MSILNIDVLSFVFVWRDSRKRSGLDVVLHSDQSSLSHERKLFLTTLHERRRTSSSHWASIIIGSFILDQWYDQSTLDMSLNRAFSLSCIWRVSLSISMSYWYAGHDGIFITTSWNRSIFLNRFVMTDSRITLQVTTYQSSSHVSCCDARKSILTPSLFFFSRLVYKKTWNIS